MFNFLLNTIFSKIGVDHQAYKGKTELVYQIIV